MIEVAPEVDITREMVLEQAVRPAPPAPKPCDCHRPLSPAEARVRAARAARAGKPKRKKR